MHECAKKKNKGDFGTPQFLLKTSILLHFDTFVDVHHGMYKGISEQYVSVRCERQNPGRGGSRR